MVSIASLWLPILLSGIFVFFASSVIHMALTAWHRNDFRALPDEASSLTALRSLKLEPGDYLFPFAGSSEAMRSDDFLAKVREGPSGVMTVMSPTAWTNMGPQLIQWFLYALLVALFAAYLASRTLVAGADYMEVFRVTGTVAFACFAMALPQRSIWWHQGWGATLRSMIDGLVYASLTAGVFGWLWP